MLAPIVHIQTTKGAQVLKLDMALQTCYFLFRGLRFKIWLIHFFVISSFTTEFLNFAIEPRAPWPFSSLKQAKKGALFRPVLATRKISEENFLFVFSPFVFALVLHERFDVYVKLNFECGKNIPLELHFI